METPKREELLLQLQHFESSDFDRLCGLIFQYQKAHNPLYAKYLKLLGPERPQPFLPISFFKTHEVKTGEWPAKTLFESSGTTGQLSSRHLVRELEPYLQNARRGFTHFYGDPSGWCILALLPNYLERGHSSLVAMADYFIRLSPYAESGFFLNDFTQLKEALLQSMQKKQKTLLLGVSFALLDFAENYPMNLSKVYIMETGGMKGRRKEITRQELHQTLQQAFQTTGIHSEYGMTELFSQAYAQAGTTYFKPAPTMKVICTEINDPFSPVPTGKTGVINIIDLANIDSMAFIQTEDLGRVGEDGSFEVLGRLDAVELRGCNLMVE